MSNTLIILGALLMIGAGSDNFFWYQLVISAILFIGGVILKSIELSKKEETR